jgi:hypothetical protein
VSWHRSAAAGNNRVIRDGAWADTRRSKAFVQVHGVADQRSIGRRNPIAMVEEGDVADGTGTIEVNAIPNILLSCKIPHDAGKNPAGSSTPNERSVWGIFASIAEFEASTPSRKLRKPTDPKCPKVFQPLSRKTQADRQKDFVGAATSPHGL